MTVMRASRGAVHRSAPSARYRLPVQPARTAPRQPPCNTSTRSRTGRSSLSFSAVVGRRCALPLIAQNAHVDEIDILAGAPDVPAKPALLDKAHGQVGADASLVVAPDAQPH